VAYKDDVHTSDQLMSLPGYASEIRLDSGVRLLLRGQVPEFSRHPAMDFLLESAVVLHKNPQFDADLTLDRGRLYILNDKDGGDKDGGQVTVRLRFGKDGSEVWDLTLQTPGTKIAVDLLKHYGRDSNYLDGEDPRMELYLIVLRGKATLKVRYDTFANIEPAPRPCFFRWGNYRGEVLGPDLFPADEMPIWSEAPPGKAENPGADEMVIALKELSKRMLSKEKAEFYLTESLNAEPTLPAGRRLAIYSMCGLDDVRHMMDALGDNNEQHVLEREAAIFALRRWIGRDAKQTRLLYDPATKTGKLLEDRQYRAKEAETLSILLHDFNDEARQSKETYELLATYLHSDKVAIAELAYWHLKRMAVGVKLPGFNAAWTAEDRRPVADKVRDFITKGSLPPPPEGPPGGGKPPPGPPPPPKTGPR
jgi:hypothetical protein